jgi:hypothetical protein
MQARSDAKRPPPEVPPGVVLVPLPAELEVVLEPLLELPQAARTTAASAIATSTNSGRTRRGMVGRV